MNFSFLKSKLFSSSIVYTLTNFFNASLPFLLLPILTSYLSEAEYGITAMFTVLTGIINPLLGVGVSGAISRAYYREEIKDFSSYVGNCLLITLVSFIVLLALCVGFGEYISEISKFPQKWLYFVVLSSLANLIITMQLSIYRVKYKTYKYAFVKIAQTLLNFSIVAYLVISLQFKWEGFVLGKVISLGLFAAVAMVYLFQNGYVKLKVSKNYIRHALAFGVPLIPHAMSGFVVSMSDRLFITNLINLSSTGSYVVAYQIGSVISLLVTSFNTAWSPWLYEKLKNVNEDYKTNLVKMTYYYFIVLALICFLFILITPIVIDLFIDRKFSVDFTVIIFVVVGFFFQGCYMMLVNYLFYFGKTKSISMVTFSVAFINLILNYFLIQRMGIIGAAIATTLSFLIQFLCIWIIAAKVYPMPWLQFDRIFKQKKYSTVDQLDNDETSHKN